MGIRKYTWVKFPNQKWVPMFGLTPSKPYRVYRITNNGSVLEINDDHGRLCSVKMNSAIKCTPVESRLAILFE